MSELQMLFDNQLNGVVLKFLKGKSVHSDTSSKLYGAIMKNRGVACYCPDPAAFAYVAFHVNRTIIGFAEGMKGVHLRLPEEQASMVAAKGGAIRNTLGKGWVYLPLWQKRNFSGQLDSLAEQAYKHAINDTEQLGTEHSGTAK